MVDLTLYRKLAGTYQVGSSQENAINQFVYQSDKIWDETLSTYHLLALSKRGDDVEITNRSNVSVPDRAVFNYNKEYSRSTMLEGQERCFLEKDSVEVGYYVKRVRTDETYLIETLTEDKFLFEDAFVRKCNTKLNFIDNQGSIRTYPCVYRISSRTEKDTTENKYIEVTTGDAYIEVQYNDFTSELTNQDGTRFILSKDECYTLKNAYNQFVNGLVYIKLEQSEINFDTDKYVDLGDGTFGWIADYENRDVFTITIDQSDSEIVTGNTLQLTAQVLKNDQVVEEDITWTSDNETVATVDSTGLLTTITDGVVNITASLTDNSGVNDSVQITATTSVVENYSIQFNPDTEDILLSSILEVNTKLLNNGVDTTDTFTYSIVGGTAQISDYEFIVVDGNNFTLTNNNFGGTVIVRCVSGVHTIDKTYTLKYFY